MSTFQLTVEIDPNQLEILNENHYSLCIGKAGAGFIWSSGTALAINKFQWMDSYQVFGTASYTVDRSPVHAQTQKRPIGFGQTCTIDNAGNMEPATGPFDPSSDRFSVVNEWAEPINVGVSCALKAPGSDSFVQLDFYVSDSQVLVDGTIELTPIDQVICWFETHAITGTVISDITSQTWRVDYTGNNPKSQTISYNANEKWQDGPLTKPEKSGSGTTMTTTTTNSDSPSAQTVTAVTTTTNITAVT